MFKEDFRPTGTDKWVFTIAPLLTGIAAFTGWSVIPLAGQVNMFGVETRLQLTDMPVAVLFVLAIGSIGIYGIVLAGWASTSTYSLLGGIRSTAQMISYEIAMGLALVAVFLTAGSMSTSDIVESQATQFGGPVSFLHIPQWYALLLIPSCAVFCIAMVAETNRAPFDLVECEQELVSGFLSDYSGFRYAVYFLAEYINMATVSAVATTLFFGGYRAPWPIPWIIQISPSALSWLDSGYMGLFWFTFKLLLFIGVFVWLRGTLPRFRYDQFMDLGWKGPHPDLDRLDRAGQLRPGRPAAELGEPVRGAHRGRRRGPGAHRLPRVGLATGRRRGRAVRDEPHAVVRHRRVRSVLGRLSRATHAWAGAA